MNRKSILPVLVLALLSSNLFAKAKNDNANPNPTTTQSASTQKSQNDPIEIILADHGKIEKIMTELNKSLDSDLSKSHAIFKELKEFLVKHETMEQEVWYPELSKNAFIKDIITNLKKEEENVSAELENLEDITDEKQWASKVKKLTKEIKHHANDEQTKLFPVVKKKFDKSALEQLGEKLQAYRKEKGMES